MVKAEGMDNVRMALKSVDGLLGLVTSLIDFESTDNYTLRLHVSEYELNSYLETTCEAFRTYASIRDIDITRESGFPYLNVRFDKDKMDSILKNILSNALKYTPRGGSIQVLSLIHISEPTRQAEISYAVFCLKKKKKKKRI